jgi:hypothetical protein
MFGRYRMHSKDKNPPREIPNRSDPDNHDPERDPGLDPDDSPNKKNPDGPNKPLRAQNDLLATI